MHDPGSRSEPEPGERRDHHERQLHAQGHLRHRAPPYPPSKVRPIVSFTGINPLLNENFTIPPGATLTMITELNVKPHIPTLCDLHPAFCNRLLTLPR